MEAMYPEYYNNEDAVNQESDSDKEEDQFNQQIEEYGKYKRIESSELLKRPARRQIKDIRKDTAYIEGNYDYNIWYDKYLTDRRQDDEKVTSMYKCNPSEDTGFTKADKFEDLTYFCTYFAKGCCAEGVNCRYYHRVPQDYDLRDDDMVRDVFGRSRHATFKKDHTGVGSFADDCTTLLVKDIVIEDRSKPARELVRTFYEAFAPWGEIVDIHLNVAKCIGFVKYSHRFYAEFAKEAMMNQSIYGGTDPISVKWAINNPFSKKQQEDEEKLNLELENAIKQKEMMNNALKHKLKEVNKNLGGGKRSREDDDFDSKLMDEGEDHKRAKYQEAEEPTSQKIAENCSNLANILQRIEANKDKS